ncbi:hypothetical protein BRCON_2042 [Candidatus Sumerlaea chitinivorans]|uniref:Uncharacterized protein n=1 Tax=Sumerlaea chitinivorans TaxID=2250252 RepID=A0A2Z4Y784_SUMC1|nr:hypothetical protein BRCON_2042 [Candidatus Sumerlaea chitinivorans]
MAARVLSSLSASQTVYPTKANKLEEAYGKGQNAGPPLRGGPGSRGGAGRA